MHLKGPWAAEDIAIYPIQDCSFSAEYLILRQTFPGKVIHFYNLINIDKSVSSNLSTYIKTNRKTYHFVVPYFVNLFLDLPYK